MVVIDTEAGNVRSFLQQLHSEKTASIYTKIDCNNQKHARTHTQTDVLLFSLTTSDMQPPIKEIMANLYQSGAP